MSREINPKDVPKLMLEGKLRFGMELEFSWNSETYGWTDPLPFDGFNWKRGKFIAVAFTYDKARFPLPALRDGDPVVGTSGTSHFKNFDGPAIVVYNRGTTKWTVQNWGYGSLVLEEWRLPTKQELESAGYTEDQINEMMERWG